jgi:hypothetical protein
MTNIENLKVRLSIFFDSYNIDCVAINNSIDVPTNPIPLRNVIMSSVIKI